MPDRRRITTADNLNCLLVNYRDALAVYRVEPLNWTIIWSEVVVDALGLVPTNDLLAALVRAGVTEFEAKLVADIFEANGLHAGDFDGHLSDAAR